VVIGLLPGAARAATANPAVLYVDRSNPACSATGMGTKSHPFCTISSAAAKVEAGQTVQVASGTYRESVSIQRPGTAAAPIAFVAARGARVTLQSRADGFDVVGTRWVTISGFRVVNTSGYGIAVSNSSHITVSNNHVSYSGRPIRELTKYGIRLSNVTDSVVSGNITDHNTSAGIALVNGSTRNVVSGNHSFGNAMVFQRAAAGIHLASAPGNTIAGNIAHDNEDSGINISGGSKKCVVYNNVTYDNGDHGIDDTFAPGVSIVANSVYKNVSSGINVEGGSTGAELANNISVDNGINSPRTRGDIRVEAGSTRGTRMDYDLLYLRRADTLIEWNSVRYRSLAAFRTVSRQETHGIQADPKWRSPERGDFHLRAGSPAIDSGDSGAKWEPMVDIEGNLRLSVNPNNAADLRPDRGAYEFTTHAAAEVVGGPSHSRF
jgi:parallel beta-helix repeat protein